VPIMSVNMTIHALANLLEGPPDQDRTRELSA